MQTLADLVKKKSRRAPGKLSGVARALGLSRATMYRRLQSGDFTVNELRELDRILQFTEEERRKVWDA